MQNLQVVQEVIVALLQKALVKVSVVQKVQVAQKAIAQHQQKLLLKPKKVRICKNSKRTMQFKHLKPIT